MTHQGWDRRLGGEPTPWRAVQIGGAGGDQLKRTRLEDQADDAAVRGLTDRSRAAAEAMSGSEIAATAGWAVTAGQEL